MAKEIDVAHFAGVDNPSGDGENPNAVTCRK
jgi:hypothetical protein